MTANCPAPASFPSRQHSRFAAKHKPDKIVSQGSCCSAASQADRFSSTHLKKCELRRAVSCRDGVWCSTALKCLSKPLSLFVHYCHTHDRADSAYHISYTFHTSIRAQELQCCTTPGPPAVPQQHGSVSDAEADETMQLQLLTEHSSVSFAGCQDLHTSPCCL